MHAPPRPFVGGVALLLAIGSALADTVILKNGSSFDGTIVEETDKHVVISLSGGTLTFPKADVVRVVRDPETRPKTPPKEEPEAPAGTPSDPVPVPPADSFPPRDVEVLGPADLARVPQSPKVDLDLRGRPLSEVLDALSEQASSRFTPPFRGSSKAIDVQVKGAPLWEAVSRICRQGPWGLCVVQDSAHDGLVLRVDDRAPLRVADIQGPLMLVGHGPVQESIFDGSGAWVDKEGIEFSLWIDPNGRMKIVEPRLEPTFLFTFEDGRQVQLRADNETQLMLGGRTWFFFAGESLSGASADVAVRIPLYGAVAVGEATLPWRSGAATASGGAEVTVRDVKCEAVDVRDEGDLTRMRTVTRVVATIHVIHAAGKLMSKISEERRQPTTEEEKLLGLPPEAMAIEPHEAWLVGEDGHRHRATLDDATGIRSPWHGYTTVATVCVGEPGFKPKEVVFRWAHDFRHFEIDFRLDDVPLRAR